MNFRKYVLLATTFTFLAASAAPAVAFPLFGKKKAAQDDSSVTRKPTASQNALIDKSIAREAVTVKEVKTRIPLVETYIQNMKPDPVMFQTTQSDQHFLARVDFGKVIGQQAFAKGDPASGGVGKKVGIVGRFKNSLGYITGLSKSLHLQYRGAGFVRMILIDTEGPNSDGFNRTNYKFAYVRNDFLGTVPTMVFDVTPIKTKSGRFHGRIWIERNGGNIVRYSGELQGSQSDIAENFHFESWRTNIQPDLWLPTSTYIEETDPKSPTHVLKMKAINHIWGYSLKIPPADSDETSVDVAGAENQAQDQNTDLSPLAAQRQWVQEAEDNVLDRLYTAGLIDAPSEFDETLATLANNILGYNSIATSRPIKVRTLLTSPLESVAIGNTILISKSMIDTAAVPTQDGAQLMGNLYSMLAFQVAHIILGHRIDTKYAFSDRMMFPSASAFQRLPMGHTDADNMEAAKKAMDLLGEKDLTQYQQYFSLYLQQLKVRQAGLKALTTPQLGDSLLKSDGTFWMQAIISKGPKLNDKDLKQQAAMPLSQYLKFDPWTDKVVVKKTSFEPLLSQRDKMPFEVTPVYLNLSYYVAPVAPAPAAAPGAAPADTTAAPAAGTTAPATGAAEPAATTAAPAASTAAPAATLDTGGAATTAPATTAPTTAAPPQ
ncbi:MAG: hypothetical protein ABI142_03805 [Bryocella sp.]